MKGDGKRDHQELVIVDQREILIEQRGVAAALGYGRGRTFSHKKKKGLLLGIITGRKKGCNTGRDFREGRLGFSRKDNKGQGSGRA